MSHTETHHTSNEDYRHWSPRSQAFTSADVLQQYLRNGWHCFEHVVVETFALGLARNVQVYRFFLCRDDEEMDVPVVWNPAVQRLITELNLQIHHISTAAVGR